MKTGITVCVLLTLLSFSDAFGCTVCMGASGQVAEASNGAIFVMLGVLGLVFSMIIGFGVALVRRSRLPIPPELELTNSLGTFTAE